MSRKAHPNFHRQGFKSLFTHRMSREAYEELNDDEKPVIVRQSTIGDIHELTVELTTEEITDPTRLEKHVREKLERQISTGKYLNPETGKQLECRRMLEDLDDYENILFPEPHNLGHKLNERREYEYLLAYRAALEAVCSGRMDKYPPFDKTPFTTPKAYETFKHLNNKYNTREKLRWTTLFECMESNSIENHMSAREYLRWVKENFEPTMKSENLQELSRNRSDTELKKLNKLLSKRTV